MRVLKPVVVLVFVVLVFVVLVLVVAVGGLGPVGVEVSDPVGTVASTPLSLPEACGDVSHSASEDPLLVVIETGEAVRFRAEHCGIDDAPGHRVCRALWLAQQLDPLVVALRTDEEHTADRAATLLRWALDDARSVSDAPLSAALGRLADSDAALHEGRSDGGNDRGRSDLLQARAEPALIDALRLAERECR